LARFLNFYKKLLCILKKLINFLFIWVFLSVLYSCKKEGTAVDPTPKKSLSAAASTFDNNVASDWLDMHLYLIKTTPGFAPPVAARSLGYASLALYESVVFGMPNNVSLAGQLNGLATLPKPDTLGKQYHWGLVANTAQYSLLRELFITTSDKNQSKVDSLRLVYETKLKTGSSDAVIQNSIRFGAELANAIFEYSKKDGGSNGHSQNFPSTYIVPIGIGNWKPTGTQKIPLLPYWGNNRTMVKANMNDLLEKPIPFSFEKNSQFYAESKNVYDISKNLTNDQRSIALFFADGAGTSTPPGHHFNVTKLILNQKKAKLDENALVFVKIGLALQDAFINCWKGKYNYNLMRPSTYINEAIDKNWKPLLNNPPFPDYASGHSTSAGAVVKILEDSFGKTLEFEDKTHEGSLINRKFSSFEQYGQETSLSRVYGGIHYKFSCDKGYASGEEIGKNILKLKFGK
jgi:hypothetical protein